MLEAARAFTTLNLWKPGHNIVARGGLSAGNKLLKEPEERFIPVLQKATLYIATSTERSSLGCSWKLLAHRGMCMECNTPDVWNAVCIRIQLLGLSNMRRVAAMVIASPIPQSYAAP